MYNEVNGNLIDLALKGEFDVIAHGCNCLSNMGAGLAPHMARTFGCDKFRMEQWGPNIQKLGCIDYETFLIYNGEVFASKSFRDLEAPKLTVVNAYTQYKYGKNHTDGVAKPLDYEALTLCMRKLNVIFKGKHIGLPQIGAGLAKGDWNRIKEIIINELNSCRVTVVIFEKEQTSTKSLF